MGSNSNQAVGKRLEMTDLGRQAIIPSLYPKQVCFTDVRLLHS